MLMVSSYHKRNGEEENCPIRRPQTETRKCLSKHWPLLRLLYCTLSIYYLLHLRISSCVFCGPVARAGGAGMSSSGEAVLRAVEAPLFWLGAVTAAWLSFCSVYRLLSGFRVWVLGNGRLVSPNRLGKWAGERPERHFSHIWKHLTQIMTTFKLPNKI